MPPIGSTIIVLLIKTYLTPPWKKLRHLFNVEQTDFAPGISHDAQMEIEVTAVTLLPSHINTRIVPFAAEIG